MQRDDKQADGRPQRQPASEAMAGRGAAATMTDRRPAAAAQRRLMEAIASSPRAQLMSPVAQRQGVEEEEPLQGRFEGPAQRQEAEPAAPNRTGLPDGLKAGIESMSGLSMDHVRVHYGSSQPAQLNALAYAQGSDIHLAPGQEQHLPHEAWHVVQQAQGRVPATMQMAGVAVNDDRSLEAEADRMGSQAAQRQAAATGPAEAPAARPPVQAAQRRAIVQRLTVANTNWNAVNSITASSGGAGGVLFMGDGGPRIAVKPNTFNDDEMVSAHVHSKIEDHDFGSGGRWKVRSLASRMAQVPDVNGIQAAVLRIGHATLSPRAQGLVAAVAQDTTLIQEAARAGASGWRQEMAGQAPDRHLTLGGNRTISNKNKVKAESPLKRLMKDNSLAVTLGRLAAADLFMGNFDRLMGSANLENFLMHAGSKTINPIDNVHDASQFRLGVVPGSPVGTARPTAAQWSQQPLVAMFIAQDFAGLAAEAWSSALGGGGTLDTHLSIYDDLIAGTYAGNAGPTPTVEATERTNVRNKVDAHLVKIRNNFAEGLRQGHQAIRNGGQLPIGNNWSPAGRTQYNDRLALL